MTQIWLGSLLAVALCAGASAQETTHTVQLNDDGTVDLIEQPNAFAMSDLATQGSWFALTDQSGDIETYFFAPEGQELPGLLLDSLDPGQAIVKANAPVDFFGIQPPSPEQITSIIEGMLSNARAAVCGMGQGRPSTFGTAVDVSAGIGISGTIQFSAEWETEQLCAGL